MKFHKVDIRGKFWLPEETDASSVPHYGTVDEGRIFYSQSDDAVYYGNRSEWVLITRREDVLNDQTKLMMGTYPLPNFWNIVSTVDDLIPLISDDETQAGTVGGSWTITGVVSGGSHDHGGATGTPNNQTVLGASDIYTTVARNNHTHSLQVDGVHSHTFNGAWRPKYTKFLVVRYDV